MVGEVPALHLYVLAIVLIHTLGHFSYVGIWRQVAAADFDVNDFKAYYTAALAIRTGQAETFLYSDPERMNLGILPDQPWVQFAVSSGIPHPSAYIYPPFFAVVLAPLTLLPYHAANLLWFGLNVALLGGSIAVLLAIAAHREGGRGGGSGGIGALTAVAIVFVALNFFPTVRALQCGQTGFLLLFLTAAALLSLLKGREALGGLCLAIAAAIKLTPILLIVWVAWAGYRRAAAWSVALLAALTAVSIAVAGWGNHLLYVTRFLPVLSRGAATYANQSVNGFLNRLLTDQSPTFFGFSDEPVSVRLLTRAAALLLLSIAFLLARPRRGGVAALPGEDERGDPSLGYALVVLTSLLVSPISWEHHYVIALIPLAVMIQEAARGDWPAGHGGTWGTWGMWLLALAYVAMAVDAFDLVRKDLPRGSRPAMSYVLYGGLLLWGLIAARLRSRRAA